MLLLTKVFRLNLTHIVDEDISEGAPAELHGHNFKVAITLRAADKQHGEPDLRTGQICDRKTLDQIFEQKIFKVFHQKRVNDLLAHGTGEILAIEFLKELRQSELGDQIISVQLVETRKNRFQSLIVGV